jgi:tetratricopeptide (TPR) repeat protein
MKPKIAFATVFLMLALTAWIWGSQIELKNGTIIEGSVKEIKNDKVILDLGEEKEMGIALNELKPHSVYTVRQQLMDDSSAQEHWTLGEYCLSNKLYDQSRNEFEKAAEIDETLKDKADEKITLIVEEEYTAAIENAVELMKQNKYEEALNILQKLIGKYPDSKYAEEATKAAAFATQMIRHNMEEESKIKEAEQKKKEQEQLAKRETELKKKYLNEVVKPVKEVGELNAAGLESEGENNSIQADKSYKKALEKLAAAKTSLIAMLDQTRDVNLLSEGREKLREINGWMVTLYNNLGQLWAMELNFREAIKWLNKALALDPSNKPASDLKVKIIELEAQRKLNIK